jgi:hypothetical protein
MKACCVGFARAERRIHALTEDGPQHVRSDTDEEAALAVLRMFFSGTNLEAERVNVHLQTCLEHVVPMWEAAILSTPDRADLDDAEVQRLLLDVVKGMLMRVYLAGFETRRAQEAAERASR